MRRHRCKERHLPLLDMPRRHEVAKVDIDPKYVQKILVRTYERAPEKVKAFRRLAEFSA
jgi:hypothetical protein